GTVGVSVGVWVDMVCLLMGRAGPGRSAAYDRQPDALVLDRLLRFEPAPGGLLGLPFVDLLDEGIDHLVLQDVADHLATLEDHPLALAGGDPQVGLARLPGAVDHTA